MEELLAVARGEAKSGRGAQVDFDAAAPYRCIGGVVYTLQLAGFSRVGFISEPLPQRP
jgi:biopolymer transport protein ExbD